MSSNTRESTFSFRNRRQKNSIFLGTIDENEVILTINRLKCNKAPGRDGIKSETLKVIANQIAKPLAVIFNRCIDKGVFPDVLKQAIIKPLFKSGDKLNIKNYRPISVISNI